jgi:hypothetical protein
VQADGTCIAIGSAGTNQQSGDIAIGVGAGKVQSGDCIAIGTRAGGTNQDVKAIAIGSDAGVSQATGCVAIGWESGNANQAEYAIALGVAAGNTNQGESSVALGVDAGNTNQGIQAIAIGFKAGETTQGDYSISIGTNAGGNNQTDNCIAIGNNAGFGLQGGSCVAIGSNAGAGTQSTGCIAIGSFAGNVGQGANAIAIGNQASPSFQTAGSICINASGLPLNVAGPAGLYISPIASVASGSLNTLCYDSGSLQVVVDTTKTFVIDHPTDSQRYLVHACLEGPESSVFYRGLARIPSNLDCVEVILPNYTKTIAKEFTVQITPVGERVYTNFSTSKVEDGKFTVYISREAQPSSEAPMEFFWTVIGKREEVEVEPLKSEYVKRGDGPYSYLTKK